MVMMVRPLDRGASPANVDVILPGPASRDAPSPKDAGTTAVAAMAPIMPVPVSEWVWVTDHPVTPAILAQATPRPGLAAHGVEHGVVDTVIASAMAAVSAG